MTVLRFDGRLEVVLSLVSSCRTQWFFFFPGLFILKPRCIPALYLERRATIERCVRVYTGGPEWTPWALKQWKHSVKHFVTPNNRCPVVTNISFSAEEGERSLQARVYSNYHRWHKYFTNLPQFCRDTPGGNTFILFLFSPRKNTGVLMPRWQHLCCGKLHPFTSSFIFFPHV